MLLLALSPGHKVGLAVTGAAFILFALASAFVFTRIRPNFPGRGLTAFIVVALVFFFGMLTAVEVFGAEPKETKKTEHATRAASQAQPTTAATTTTQTSPPTTSTTAPTTTSAGKAQTVAVTEKEFKISLASTSLHAGEVTFRIKNTGQIPHDLAIVGGPKTSLIPPGKTATLTATLKAGALELYCTVPGHKQAGMDLKLTVGGGTAAAPKPKPTAAAQSVNVSEKEFKITLSPSTLQAGKVTFQIKNDGQIPHDLAIVGGPKSSLISPGKSATLTATLSAGPIELYCTVPGHKQAGMDLKLTVS